MNGCGESNTLHKVTNSRVAGEDDMIRVWSKDGELLIEFEGHDSWVMSLCWSKDGAYIFSASLDNTVRKWQSIDGKELVVIRGHTKPVESLCLSPDGCHLLSASDDYSVASGISKPISKLETHSGTTAKSWPSPCPPMANTLPVLSLDWMQKSMCGAWKQHSSMLAGLGAMQSPTRSSRDMQLDPEIYLLRLDSKATTEAWQDIRHIISASSAQLLQLPALQHSTYKCNPAPAPTNEFQLTSCENLQAPRRCCSLP
ncbi:WD40-repeat-containing domain protein [Suillus subaureus]|uniref:WD40-repeat-containing domain protein n=1 Tax=Suillus subaureus TaxID=48587 RepID=A0A9P7J904_9AGAM|nr:WD40-repeat-containing domain protein [Suillus subaureus]KAG1808932.1 WD40-repeat-containing domain protein [Suillus subaureus]